MTPSTHAELKRLRARVTELVTPDDMREHLRPLIAERDAPYDVAAIVRDLVAELGTIDLTDPHYTDGPGAEKVQQVVERHELDPTRLCEWCDQPLPVGSHRQRRTCSSAHRTALARWERANGVAS